MDFIPPAHPVARIASNPAAWRRKALARLIVLFIAGAGIAAVVGAFGIARDYGYLQASILTGSAEGYYHALAARLARRAERGRGSLTVIPTAGSVENVSRLARSEQSCADKFALIQDGTPALPDAHIELLGRLPEPESLFLLGRQDNMFHAFADLHGASIGIGPEGSGTAYLMRQLFEGPDLQQLNVHLTTHELSEQAGLLAQGALDVAALVIQENAELLHSIIGQYHLDIVSPRDLEGVISRYPGLSLGSIPVGRYDVARPIPAVEKQVTHLATLVVASPCAKRADRIALLMLLAAELPGFVRANPPSATNPATTAALAPEAQQFFLSGGPEFADRYFPWLVNLMSPVYWVYLVMAVTILFNAMKAFSRFRLWRIDAARARLEAAVQSLVGPGLTHSQMREAAADRAIASAEQRADAKAIMDQLGNLRVRCERQTGSFVTPMGDEMFYRYQQFLIDEARTTVAALLERSHSSWTGTIGNSSAPEISSSLGRARTAPSNSDAT
jgi:TRAP-type uncharacterized transport system substrate-binding protein